MPNVTLKLLRKSLNETRKLVGTYSHGDNTAKVYKHTGEDDDGDPYHVRLFKGGKEHKPAEYFTNDADDAHGTAQRMVKEEYVTEEYKNWRPPHSIWNQTQGNHTGHVSRVNNKYQYEIFDEHGKSKIKDSKNDLYLAKKAVLNHLDKLKESIDEASNPWKRYESLEDDNRHSENVIHMAKHVGNEDDVKKAEAIFARHKKEGHLSDENGYDREVLSKKLWPKFHKAFAPKD